MTFSIVARDMSNGDFGVAVASKFLAVGSVVPWVYAEAGAIATQAMANMSFGPDGLLLLKQGYNAQAALDHLLANDDNREQRQVGIVDIHGRAATWTGNQCFAWAGGITGRGYAIQGNILAGEHVIMAMANAFNDATGELAERLLAALTAGDAAGGDSRGRQSAALYVAREGAAYGGVLDRYVDLRVDDHEQPTAELARLLKLHRFFLTKPDPAKLLPITAELASEIQTILQKLGTYDGAIDGDYGPETQAALWNYGSVENLEERLTNDATIDPLVLDFLRSKVGD